MKMSSLIPPEYRLLAAGIVCAVLVAAGAAAGWKVSRWKADAHWGDIVAKAEKEVSRLKTDVSDRDASIAELKASLETQNAAIERLHLESEAIAQAQEQARKRAEESAKASAARLAQLQRQIANGASPEDSLKTYWELRQ